MGESGFGWLNAALGAGALAGGLAAVGLVARRKLAGIFGIALVLWGAPIALVGAWPRAGWALVCLGIVGIGNALLDVSGFTLLQRTVDEHVLGAGVRRLRDRGRGGRGTGLAARLDPRRAAGDPDGARRDRRDPSLPRPGVAPGAAADRRLGGSARAGAGSRFRGPALLASAADDAGAAGGATRAARRHGRHDRRRTGRGRRPLLSHRRWRDRRRAGRRHDDHARRRGLLRRDRAAAATSRALRIASRGRTPRSTRSAATCS